MIKKCIILAGGRGSSWAPVSGYLPKEMLPLVNRPVIEWVIDEVISSGCTEIIVVINHRKEIIRNYLSKNKRLNKKANIKFIYTQDSYGIAHSILLCQEFIGKEPYAIAIPDMPTISRKPVLGQLVKVAKSIDEPAYFLSFSNFPPNDLHLYSECLLKPKSKNVFDIEHFCPPTQDPTLPHHAGSRLRMSGRFIFLPGSFQTIQKLLKTMRDLEIKDDQIIQEEHRQRVPMYAVQVEGRTYDTGTPTGYVRANTAFFKKWLQKRK